MRISILTRNEILIESSFLFLDNRKTCTYVDNYYCSHWRNLGYCNPGNYFYNSMKVHCKATCGFCGGKWMMLNRVSKDWVRAIVDRSQPQNLALYILTYNFNRRHTLSLILVTFLHLIGYGYFHIPFDPKYSSWKRKVTLRMYYK